MSGLNSLSSNNKEGKIVNANFIKLFEKYNFDFYPNSFSLSDNSVTSITSLINFKEDISNINKEFVNQSKNYFSEYEIKKNLLFNKYKSISVIQNIHINYCNNSNVSKCYQYNPLNLKILDAEIDEFSNILSAWSLNGSIVGKFIWRFFKQVNLIKSTLEPEGEKLFINQLLKYTKKDMISKKFDLVFVHLLVPHKPYGFNSNCEYNVKLSNLNIYLNEIDSIKQHNIERNCVISLMDNFLSDLDPIEDYKIFMLSDHGSRIQNKDISSLSAIFAYKDFIKNKSKMIDDKASIQTLFKIINNE